MNSIKTIAKLNLKNIGLVYWIVGITTFVQLIQMIVLYFILRDRYWLENMEISVGSFLYLLPLLAAILIPALNFRRIVNIGGKRNNFLIGSLFSYIFIAVFISLGNLAFHYTVDAYFERAQFYNHDLFGGIANLVEVFRWIENGFVIAFLQQTAFLFLVMTFIHTLTSIQDKWYGWVTDVFIIAIISVFTPIAVLRSSLIWFFNLIIFNQYAWFQIIACLVIGLSVYALNKPIYARKTI